MSIDVRLIKDGKPLLIGSETWTSFLECKRVWPLDGAQMYLTLLAGRLQTFSLHVWLHPDREF